jgi:hypothetical protein
MRTVAPIALLLILASLADACPTCKQAVTEGGNHESTVQGYFWSIIFMMSMPFLIFGGLGTYFYVQVVKARLAQSAANAVPAPEPA